LDTPAILTTRDPRAQQNVKMTKVIHCRVTPNNTPGEVPMIEQTHLPSPIHDKDNITPPVATRTRLAIPPLARSRLILQHALTALMLHNTFFAHAAFTPKKLNIKAPTTHHTNFEYFTNPVVHPVTGKNIGKIVRMSSQNSTINSWTSPIKGCFSYT